MTTFATDEDTPLYTLDNVSITVSSAGTTAGGLLTISQPSLRWQSPDVDHEFAWHAIMLHAVVREGVPEPQIFLQLDDNTEIHLTPQTDVCDEIFAAMCKAAELNPDKQVDEGEDNNEGSMWFRQDNDTKLAAYDNLLQGVVPGQFEDAAVEEEEAKKDNATE